MKRIFFLLLIAGIAGNAVAQSDANFKKDSIWRPSHFAPDALLPHWLVDVNLLGGGVSQSYTMANSINNYSNAIGSVSNTGSLSFKNGLAYGFDAQLAYFFGKSNTFGLGLGFMYLGEQGDATLNQFTVQYQSTDSKGQIFRQIVTADGGIKEHLNITDLNIPLLLKYKHRFSQRWGFTADAGALFNLQMKNRYSSNAAFDYEAIYQVTTDGSTKYDASPTPNVNDILYTKAQYNRVNPPQNENFYFNNTLRGEGYNVGLGITPNSNKGTVSYMTGSVGLLVQPGVNYYFSDKTALNLGVYFLYQPMMNSSSNNNQMLTNKLGDYSTVMDMAKNITNISYGLNLGIRIYMGKGRDRDHDGIPDRQDRCPDVAGPVRFNGCPDSDGDGIPDIDDACPKVAGIAKFHGCPDSDGDGIPDAEDACPYAPGPAKYHGCPDSDGDGIIDKNDSCPHTPGLAIYNGCPDTDGDGIPDNQDACPTIPGVPEYHGCPAPPVANNDDSKVSVPILFEVDKYVIHKSSYPTLIEAAHRLNDDQDAIIIVDGYTDNTGSEAHNEVLSMRRAKAVKAHLEDMGIDPKRIQVQGHSDKDPVAPNDSPENKLKNRRAVMHLSTADKK